ncbi:hypothetical protein BCR41DRAFT_314724 [Lobosporangium transversale]|uniref:JmjC domain-containing protein n=1 Tax=Lobosporangium transversale TaxID=64571 RepID=A0A1Y2G632_9FUNG|nr:hypothetical protein BCR41DRAFT_314724 [Lobosporangium transversale]ORY97057.1 hypothetical protein BCR41DRAFT_314724 [Lobosporangium transversale]|eukprot:XP_021875603.1 hypothetical protein BCR41DRAFT_314724 [Lobosporangium transversale]
MSLQHPLGIKPLGNYYMDATQPDFTGSCRGPSLGLLSRLTDEIIMEILNLLSSHDLLTLGAASRVLYGLTHLDDMWKSLTIEKFGGDWEWEEDNWRATFLKRSDPKYDTSMILKNRSQMKLKSFYSDVLFQPFYCAAIGMEPYIAVENIDRRSNLTVEEFVNEYERPGKPVIIIDGAQHWPARKKWSTEYFLERWSNVLLRAESVEMTIARYLKYAAGTKDESPLYLFDKNFVERCDGIQEDIEVPPYFREDFFGMMGDKRPDYRWLIIGPARSGSTFHKDPNATSAWNAVITGSKKWIMFPPHILPPGVFTNEDESEVTSPVSLMEWFSNFYASTQLPNGPADRPLEGICREGEVMFVPRGWWHAVVNLEESIAVTQNYVGSQNLKETMEFLYIKRDQVSGVKNDRKEGLYEEFKEAFFKMNSSQEIENSENDTEKSKVGKLSHEETTKRKQLLEMWTKHEHDIELLSKASKHSKKWSKNQIEESSAQLSFWEQAKLGLGYNINNTRGGETEVNEDPTVAPSCSDATGTAGFVFGFDFKDEEIDNE